MGKIIDSMQKLKIASLPNAKIDLEMAAVAYFDWDSDTRKMGRPVVSVFGGKEAMGGVPREKTGGYPKGELHLIAGGNRGYHDFGLTF